MTKRAGTNSIFVLACRTFPHLKFSYLNFISPILIGAFFGIIFLKYVNGTGLASSLAQISSIFLSFNGAVLGLVIAGYVIYASFPNEDLLVFSICNKPNDGRFSFLKFKLLIFFKTFFWVFLCSVLLSIFYVFLIVYPSSEIGKTLDLYMTRSLRIFLAVFFIAGLQAKVFIELKIFIFTVYNSALTQARLMAKANSQEPFDEYND
ncbi:hypothetical protein FBR05_01770 [Deltaproteobacteria bacterium PRO3]|nr:hypothetical protein [Deltaproteobacteria bacterium PRO3]